MSFSIWTADTVEDFRCVVIIGRNICVSCVVIFDRDRTFVSCMMSGLPACYAMQGVRNLVWANSSKLSETTLVDIIGYIKGNEFTW